MNFYCTTNKTLQFLGKKWHDRRKVITPAFHFNILEKFVEIFDRLGNTVVDKLKKYDVTDDVEFYPIAVLYALDVMCGKLTLYQFEILWSAFDYSISGFYSWFYYFFWNNALTTLFTVQNLNFKCNSIFCFVTANEKVKLSALILNWPPKAKKCNKKSRRQEGNYRSVFTPILSYNSVGLGSNFMDWVQKQFLKHEV